MSSPHAHAAVSQAVAAPRTTAIDDLFPQDGGLTLRDVLHFHSGTNTGGLIRGYVDAAQPICLPVNDATRDILALVRRVSDRVPILLDSGAFGAFTAAVRQLDPEQQIPRFDDPAWRASALPLATLDFRAIAAAYATVAADHPRNVTLVLPDVVGFQDESLALLEQFRAEFQWVSESPVTALLPIQRGFLTPSEYHTKAVEALGFLPDGWGFPSREAAMSVPEIVAGVRDALRVGMRRIHFLGIGRESNRFRQILGAINQLDGVDLLCLSTDANTTRAYVGQGRPQTQRRYEVLGLVPAAWLEREVGMSIPDYVAIRWGAFLDGEDPSLLKPLHSAWRDAGLARGAKVGRYSSDLSSYLEGLLDPETGDTDERIDAIAREVIEREFRAGFETFATAAATYDFFTGYPQPEGQMVTSAQPGDDLHVGLRCGAPRRRAPACDSTTRT